MFIFRLILTNFLFLKGVRRVLLIVPGLPSLAPRALHLLQHFERLRLEEVAPAALVLALRALPLLAAFALLPLLGFPQIPHIRLTGNLLWFLVTLRVPLFVKQFLEVPKGNPLLLRPRTHGLFSLPLHLGRL